MGWPVEHSLSPRLHSYWLKQYGLDGSYEKLAVKPDDLLNELKTLKTKGFGGVNLTVPHKEAALGIVDYMDDLVKRVGAVNTIVVRPDGKLEGRNTDVYGFAENLRQGGYKSDQRAVAVLGAGGAARAIIVALQDMGVGKIHMINRTFEKAQELAQEFSTMEQSHFLPADEPAEEAIKHIHHVTPYKWGDKDALQNVSLLVNATSLGLKGQPPLEIDLGALPKDATVTDIVYAPLETELLKKAKARGHKTIDGLGMLLYQAQPAFEAFFGKKPEVTKELRAHIEASL